MVGSIWVLVELIISEIVQRIVVTGLKKLQYNSIALGKSNL